MRSWSKESVECFRRAVMLAIVLCLTGVIKAERLPVKIYTSADGLGSSAAFSLTRDSLGFIWLCSRDGLVRFDGYRFITYRIGNDNADPAVFSLLPTRNSGYWIDLNRGTDYRFVAKGDARLLEPIQQPSAKNDPRIPLGADPLPDLPLPGFEDSAGNLWAFDDRGIYLIREAEGRYLPEPVELRLPGNPMAGFIRSVFQQGSDGSVWIGTPWGLVRRLPDGRQIHLSFNPQNNNDPVSLLAEDKDGRIWLAHADGLMVLLVEPLSELAAVGDFTARKIAVKPCKVGQDGQAQLPERAGEAVAFSFADFLRRDDKAVAEPYINKLLSASDGRLWIANNRGLMVFDGKRFLHFSTQHGLGQTAPAYIAEDDQGQIWMLSNTGLIRLNPKGLTSFDQADGLANASVHAIYEDRNGELNVVTDRANLSRFQDGSFKTVGPRLPADSTWQWHSNVALLDSRGDWWVVTTERVYRYSGVRRIEDMEKREPTAVYDGSNGMIGNYNFLIFEDSKGDIWISNFSHGERMGLTRWQRSSGRFHYFFTDDGLPEAPAASAFAEDKAGNLWFGFYEGGIARYTDGRFTPLNIGDGNTPETITDLHVDRMGRLWIASSIRGLTRVDDPASDRPAFKRYAIADGLASNNVRCVTEDSFGNIYVGTVRGVNRLSPETGHIKYYGTGDGLASDFVNVAYRDRAGALWFGTLSGLSRLVPEPDPPSQPPPILISGLHIAGLDYSVSPLGQREVFVPEQGANQNNVRIEFFSIGAGGDSSTRYQYKLEGGDADWSQPTVERSVTFANLQPGEYRFLVRAIKADGVSSREPASVFFTILPPVWQRWWFMLLVASAILLVAYALYRYRVSRLVELERVRTRIATDLHDDIGASLSRMAILSEVVKQQTATDHKESSAMLTEIAESARGLVDSMSDIVWAIDPRKDDLSSLAQRIRRFASDVLEPQGIRWRFDVPDEIENIKLPPEHRRHLYLIFKEAINNIARHAQCTEVRLNVSITQNRLDAEISDDGRGLSDDGSSENAATFGGNGLRNMRARAAELGGSLVIDSASGRGTSLKVSLPLKVPPGRLNSSGNKP